MGRGGGGGGGTIADLFFLKGGRLGTRAGDDEDDDDDGDGDGDLSRDGLK